MENRPLISVVIPAYNVEKYIYKCLDSIFFQSEQNFEILVYDDGSSDNTLCEIARFKNKKLKVFKGEENKGVVHARNFLLSNAAGEFIALQDADDWSHRDRLGIQASYLKMRTDLGACGTQFIKVVGNEFVYRSQFPSDRSSIISDIPNVFHFLPGSIMLRRSVLGNVGYYNTFFGNDGNEDLYFISKVALASGLENVNRHLYYYNLNLDSLTKLGNLNKRRVYIHQISAHLLKDLICNGTNLLESGNILELERLELDYSQECGDLSRFQVFEKMIGQLVYYKQFMLAARETIRYGFKTGEALNAVKLLSYLLRHSFRYES